MLRIYMTTNAILLTSQIFSELHLADLGMVRQDIINPEWLCTPWEALLRGQEKISRTREAESLI